MTVSGTMRIDVYFSPASTDELSLRGRTAVVVDVLRATTTAATALQNGAREIIPAPTVESAVKISGNLFGDVTLLGGERNGKRIEGFHLGNSPAEYVSERVKGKSIVFASTNGSPAMVRARYARDMVLCGFVNLSAVVRFLHNGAEECAIVCAGQNGMFALEDAVCAGMLVQRLGAERPDGLILSDAAVAAEALWKSFGKNLPKLLKTCEHGRYLAGIGFDDDLTFCGGVDTVPVLPRLAGNVIRLRKENEK